MNGENKKMIWQVKADQVGDKTKGKNFSMDDLMEFSRKNQCDVLILGQCIISNGKKRLMS